jgi:hypothetical protein
MEHWNTLDATPPIDTLLKVKLTNGMYKVATITSTGLWIEYRTNRTLKNIELWTKI